MYLNKIKTQWLGEFSEYLLDGHGVERRKKVRVVLSLAKREGGTPVRKSEAKNLLQPYLNRVNQQSTSPTRERKSATFEAFATIWENDYLVLSKPSTQSSVRTQLRILKAEFGPMDIRQIDAGNMQRLIARLALEGRQPKTIRNLWGTVSLIWQAALAQRYVDSVLPKPKLPKAVKKTPRFFTLEEAALIISSAPERERCLYWLFAESGIRAGEIAGIPVDEVKLDSIGITQSVWGGKVQRPKSPNAIRTIAVSPQLAALLWKQVGRQNAAGHKLLFTNSNGSPLDMNVERSRRLRKSLEGLVMPKAGYHAFRHFNVSLMDSLRVPLKTIQERIGHSLTGSFTLDVYGHALDWKSNEDAAIGLGNELEKAVAMAEAELERRNVENSARLSALNGRNSQADNLEVSENA